jgi:hypothetical protein
MNEFRFVPVISFALSNELIYKWLFQYCTDFLCRQALIQLIMWREGLRNTVHQRAPDDERQAYNIAADKLAEGHWWEEVKNRRKELLSKKRERERSMPMDLDRRARRRR